MADINACRSYKTKERLQKALNDKGIGHHRHVVVCNEAGRYTAIFPVHNINTDQYGIQGAAYLYPQLGFMILG